MTPQLFACLGCCYPLLFFGRYVGFLTWQTLLGPNPGFEAVRPVAGPMGRSVADIERMARVLFGERSARRQDYFPAPVPYRDVTLPKTLRFGYYLNGASCTSVFRIDIHVEGGKFTDGAVKGSPACHRAVLETVEALRKEGHECIEIESPDCACAYSLSILHGRTEFLIFSRTSAAVIHCNHFCRRVQ